jgi:Leucine-rich repeat (LRR) protein
LLPSAALIHRQLGGSVLRQLCHGVGGGVQRYVDGDLTHLPFEASGGCRACSVVGCRPITVLEVIHHDISILNLNVPRFRHIRRLVLRGNNITSLRSINWATSLEELDVSSNDLTILAGVKSGSLRYFDFSDNNVSNSRAMGPCPRLAVLIGTNNSLRSNADLEHVAEMCPALEEVDLVHNDLGAMAALGACRRLRYIDMRENDLDRSPREVEGVVRYLEEQGDDGRPSALRTVDVRGHEFSQVSK